ncbi:MAG: addiction module protein [Planctomycetes bacterium]|nr:addiction module protein [Planctomycetota bacterium]
MPQTIGIDAIRKLSNAEPLALIDSIWESLYEEDANIPISKAAMAEMERRAKELRENPESGLSHDEVIKWLRSKQWR